MKHRQETTISILLLRQYVSHTSVHPENVNVAHPKGCAAEVWPLSSMRVDYRHSNSTHPSSLIAFARCCFGTTAADGLVIWPKTITQGTKIIWSHLLLWRSSPLPEGIHPQPQSLVWIPPCPVSAVQLQGLVSGKRLIHCHADGSTRRPVLCT